MNEEEIRQHVGEALERLVNEDSELLLYDVNERSITHSLAIYLDETLPNEWDVDIEYNRVGEEEMSKEVSVEYLKSILPRDVEVDDLNAKTVYPDVIVHHRGQPRDNLLAIEAKKSGRSGNYDRDKLTAYVKELGYAHGVFVELIGTNEEETPDYDCDWYPFE